MPMKPREMETLILANGWMFKNQEGSHKNYIHPTKPGKVTIPFHKGKDLNKKTAVQERIAEIYHTCTKVLTVTAA